MSPHFFFEKESLATFTLATGVHSAARKGNAIAMYEHLNAVGLPVSQDQLGRLRRLQHVRNMLRKHRMSKVPHFSFLLYSMVTYLVKIHIDK